MSHSKLIKAWGYYTSQRKYYISECPKYCSMCYNESECYECTQGYYLSVVGECRRKLYSLNAV